MSGFKALRDVSNNFEHELREWSEKLFSTKVEQFEDALAKRIQDLSMYSAKLKLLQAKPLTLTHQVIEQPVDNALKDFGETATTKVIEQVTVKSLTGANAVKKLFTTPNLEPGLVERKDAILKSLIEYSVKESQLRQLDAVHVEREEELAALRAEWDRTMATLRDLRVQNRNTDIENRGPLYVKLNRLVLKLEVMRWMIGRLVCARGAYDWLADPHQRLSALALTRTHNTVDLFTQE